MARRSPYDTAFGASTSKLLAKRRMTQLDLTNAVGKHPAYTNQVLTGGRRPSPEYVDLVANALGLSDQERIALHRSAAKDYGFQARSHQKVARRGRTAGRYWRMPNT